jgi:hypothetical protein
MSQTITAGQTATFSVTATGTAPLSYQWQKSGTAITGATSSSYTTPAETTADTGAQFTVVISNSAGSVISNAAILTVSAAPAAPSITAQPTSQTITAGQTATFSVTATGTAPLSYQWQKSGTPITGATSSSYTTPAETTADTGAQFAVVISNSAGNVTSIGAILTVNAVPPGPLTPSTSTLNFGSVNVGSSSTLGVTFTNSGASNITVSNVVTSGPGFTASGLSAGLVVTPGQTVTLNVTFAPAAAGSVTGSVTVTSNASNSPTGITLSGSSASASGAPICGQPNDGLVHIPPNWTTFVAPVTGQSYVDPVFGCTVKRLTNSSIEETLSDGTHPSLMHYYSTFSPMNATDTMLLLISDNVAWRVKDINGNVVVPAANMPAMNNGHPVWDASNGSVFYYTVGNSLMQGTINGSLITSAVVHTFSEYGGIVSPDSSDLSQDGDHIALVGQNAINSMDIFVWSFSKQSKTSVYTTLCSAGGSVTSTPQPGCLHKLELTADNLLSIQFAGDGAGVEQGVRLWTGVTLSPLQNTTDHYDTGYDLQGNSVFIELGNSSTLTGITNPCPSGWGLDVRNTNNVFSAVCLLDNLPSWHVSYRGNASQPWAALSFFDWGRTASPEWFNTNPNFVAPSTSNWQLYEDELILARVDANNNNTLIYRLAHARSRSLENYWATPRAAISRDGKYIIFDSNMGYPNGCPANMHVATDCFDVYLLKVR